MSVVEWHEVLYYIKNKEDILDIVNIDPKTIVVTTQTRHWCKEPYPDHKNGCPNFGKGLNCPPNAPLLNIEELMINYHQFKLVYVTFNIEQYYLDRKAYYESINKPQSEREIKCCLRWQNVLKSLLLCSKIIIESDYVLGCGSGFIIEKDTPRERKVPSMESVGIDVITTFKNNGLEIERIPKHFVRLVCLVCNLKSKQSFVQTSLFSFTKHHNIGEMIQ